MPASLSNSAIVRSLREGSHYLKGKNILRRYSAHYRQARRVFEAEGTRSEIAIESLRELGVRSVVPGGIQNLIDLPDDYAAAVARVSMAAGKLFERPANCRFFPPLPAAPVGERTEDIPAIMNGEVITVQLRNPFKLDGLMALGARIMPQIERKVYGSHAIVDKVYVYRSPVSRQEPSASWIWHFDNLPHEVLKVMIYLTDVTDGCAPFEYIRNTRSAIPLIGAPVAPFYGHSRIANDEVTQRLNKGYERCRVTGPAGTMLVFDQNVVHRGTLATESHRDALVFQVRPATFRVAPYIDRRWTGSFQHLEINRDPRELTPQERYGKLETG